MKSPERLKMWFKKVFAPALQSFVKTVFGSSAKASPAPPPPTSPSGEEEDNDNPPSTGHPYRESEAPEAEKKEEDLILTCETSGDADRPKDVIEAIKVRTKRRAARYFRGKEVKHRVTDRGPDSIEFGFFRRSGKPVKVRWHKEKQEETKDQK